MEHVLERLQALAVINRRLEADKGPMKIRVTQEDIDHGEYYLADACPITLAVQRVSGLPLGGAITGTDQVTMIRGSEWVQAPLPQEARDFLKEFDSGSSVRPFTFSLADAYIGSHSADTYRPVTISLDGFVESKGSQVVTDVARWNESVWENNSLRGW